MILGEEDSFFLCLFARLVQRLKKLPDQYRNIVANYIAEMESTFYGIMIQNHNIYLFPLPNIRDSMEDNRLFRTVRVLYTCNFLFSLSLFFFTGFHVDFIWERAVVDIVVDCGYNFFDLSQHFTSTVYSSIKLKWSYVSYCCIHSFSFWWVFRLFHFVSPIPLFISNVNVKNQQGDM